MLTRDVREVFKPSSKLKDVSTYVDVKGGWLPPKS